ncbi:collagen-like protein [Gilvimarinus sp. 1_MG-2023]|uniref:collagen-like protein n=1 Tax=Gilvimarinus sp. 1_MG-2023 TaxID=3062638 RepID=UPI0026E4859E|nr:collagen-like protein [Gilvimarinus sp. 1_MG-2023]MDO6745615.1 hypothetical protein [Gilvimarinus sp. 1_MG-2023]
MKLQLIMLCSLIATLAACGGSGSDSSGAANESVTSDSSSVSSAASSVSSTTSSVSSTASSLSSSSADQEPSPFTHYQTLIQEVNDAGAILVENHTNSNEAVELVDLQAIVEALNTLEQEVTEDTILKDSERDLLFDEISQYREGLTQAILQIEINNQLIADNEQLQIQLNELKLVSAEAAQFEIELATLELLLNILDEQHQRVGPDEESIDRLQDEYDKWQEKRLVLQAKYQVNHDVYDSYSIAAKSGTVAQIEFAKTLSERQEEINRHLEEFNQSLLHIKSVLDAIITLISQLETKISNAQLQWSRLLSYVESNNSIERSLTEKVNNLTLVPGPQGPPGERGPRGGQGEKGVEGDGLNDNDFNTLNAMIEGALYWEYLGGIDPDEYFNMGEKYIFTFEENLGRINKTLYNMHVEEK